MRPTWNATSPQLDSRASATSQSSSWICVPWLPLLSMSRLPCLSSGYDDDWLLYVHPPMTCFVWKMHFLRVYPFFHHLAGNFLDVHFSCSRSKAATSTAAWPSTDDAAASPKSVPWMDSLAPSTIGCSISLSIVTLVSLVSRDPFFQHLPDNF